MPQTKQASKRKRLKEAVPAVGIVGMSLALASGASAAPAVGATPDTPLRPTGPGPQMTLTEEEIADVSLGTFFVFDRETGRQAGEQYARGCGRCSGSGCGGYACWALRPGR